ncbi:4747_t:CDS:2 [Dentiscutata erythropus]|uniref:4747_t:CDS:1 n=1 Tax=Dentiscutata erythropus TaxID=1348616 RepID=A0A9N9FWZ9_9GLOM|nr:4747_t:CDS:2 [Dentiscutata erythropus]
MTFSSKHRPREVHISGTVSTHLISPNKSLKVKISIRASEICSANFVFQMKKGESTHLTTGVSYRSYPPRHLMLTTTTTRPLNLLTSNRFYSKQVLFIYDFIKRKLQIDDAFLMHNYAHATIDSHNTAIEYACIKSREPLSYSFMMIFIDGIMNFENLSVNFTQLAIMFHDNANFDVSEVEYYYYPEFYQFINTHENNEILDKDFIFTYLSAMENNSCIANDNVNMSDKLFQVAIEYE